MTSLLKFFIAFVLLVTCQLATVKAAWTQVVFDNTVDLVPSTFRLKGNGLRGAEVDLGEAARVVELVWLLTGQGSGVDDLDIEMAIFANDGAGGAPSSLLWQQTFNDLVIAPSFDFYSFSLPSLDVPGNITVVTRNLSSSPISTGYALSNSSSVGSFVENWIQLPDGNWVSSDRQTTEAFRLTAVPVPEPGGVILVLLGAPLAALRRTRSA